MNNILCLCLKGNRLFYFLIVMVLGTPASAQEIGINLNARLSKEFDWGKKWKFTLHQRIAITPEFTTIESPYQDLFDDFDLIPGFDEDDLYEDDEKEENEADDDDEEEQSNESTDPQYPFTPDQELDNDFRRLESNFRTATGWELEWRIKKWLRFSQSYDFLWRPGRTRHALETTLSIRPKISSKKWLTDWRISWQQVGEHRSKGWRIDHGLRARWRIQYKLDKRKRIYLTPGINGEWDDGIYEWDRFRLESGLTYKIGKKQQIQFAYRYQERLNKRNRKSHDINLRYNLNF